MNIKQIVVHRGPHLDELAAVWLLRKLGEKLFPGVSKAKIVAWGAKELAEVGSSEIALTKGILLVGIGGGMFDDHLRDGQSKRTECAATLVAKSLDILGNPLYTKLLGNVLQADSEAEGPLQCFAESIKSLNRYWVGSIDLEVIYNLVDPFIVVEIEKRKEYLEARKLFDTRYKTRVCGVPVSAADGIDNCQYVNAAEKGGARVIIQRNSNGLTQIFGCEDMDLSRLAVKIRKAEIAEMRNGNRPRFLSDDELLGKGTLLEIPQWYLDDAFLLNGSESHPEVPPSQIKFSDIVCIVEKHIAETVNRRGREVKK